VRLDLDHDLDLHLDLALDLALDLDLGSDLDLDLDLGWAGLGWAGLDWTGLDRVERDDGKMMERAVGDAALSGCRTCGTSPSPRALLIPIYVLSYVREHQADDETQGFIRTVDIAGG